MLQVMEGILMDISIGKCGPVRAIVRSPPSKSYTHRALIIAALADGISTITGQLDADDTRITARALASLGVRITWEQDRITVYGTGGSLKAPAMPINIEDSGTSMRLLTAVCLLADGPVTITGSARMQERPIGPLVGALNQVGGSITYITINGYPPIHITGELLGGDIPIDRSISSQFISSLLIASPYARSEGTVRVTGQAVSEPYIRITAGMMSLFGVTPHEREKNIWQVPNKPYQPGKYTVEGDYSSASYWFAIAAITRGTVTVQGLHPYSAQGDRRLLDILGRMGCTISWDIAEEAGLSSVTVTGNTSLSGVTVNMADCPDVVQTLAMVAAVACSQTRISGIHHLREKESDRIGAIVNGLSTLGIEVEAYEDEIVITPGPLHGGTIHPHRDHRTAMSFAVLGSCIGDVTILDAGCVTKSYPEFWEVFGSIWKTAGSC